MPLLARKGAPKLLTRVQGKQHATQDDYVDTLPHPPTSNSMRSSASRSALIDTEGDINRDPESSDDERTADAQLDGPVGFKRPSHIPDVSHTLPAVSTFKKPVSSSPASLLSKRSSDSDEPSSDTEDAIFSSPGSKRQRKSYGGNIHAAPTKARFKPQVYGKGVKSRSPKRDSAASFKQLKKPKAEDDLPAPKFQLARGADMFQFKGTTTESTFKTPRASMEGPNGGGTHSRSPSLSSLSSAPNSPGVEEIQTLDLPVAQPYTPKAECTICGRSVDLFLKQEFEDEFAPGKHMSYKWQQRFCRYHKQHEARQLWQERSYPDIDWDGLERRMMKYHSHLESVMSGKHTSPFRDELEQRVKSRAKTTMQAVNSEDAKGGAHVGYYGPRGEKAM
jgi:hypothetical protein